MSRGAFSLTVSKARSEDEKAEITERALEIVQQLLAMPGFISWVGATIGNRLYTITTWESAEAVKQLRKSDAHADAMRRYWRPGLATGGQTGVWTVDHLSAARRK
jgi:heme-degrading monooxygenase HmoA